MSKLFKLISASLIAGMTFASCSDDGYIIDSDGQPLASRSSVRANVASHEIDDDMLKNIRPFIFNGEDNGTRGEFYGIPTTSVINAQRALDMTMRPGTWDIRLVTAPTAALPAGVNDLSTLLLQPSHGKKASASKMYIHEAVNGILPDMLQIYTSHMNGVDVQNESAGGTVNTFESPIYFLRNYSRVRVVLDFGKELSLEQGSQKVYLSNIPSTLNWEGGLYPSASNPDIAPEPMASKAFTTVLKDSVQDEVGGPWKKVIESIDTLDFLVPAHRGSDFLNDNPVDTATSKININFDFLAADGTPVSKTDVPVNIVPRPNTEMIIHVSYEKRQLAVYPEIIPWTEHDATASMGAQHVKVDKTSIQLAWKDTLHVDCDRAYTVTRASDATWITVNKISDGVYEIVANVDTYVDNNPRTSYINVTSGNYTKRIPVTQRPERGTIKVNVTGQPNVKSFWLSPPHNTKDVTVTSIGGDWTSLPAIRLKEVKTGAAGTSNITVTRQVDTHIYFDEFDEAYGKGPVVFKNKKTLDTDTLWIDNLFIGADDDVLEIEQPNSGSLNVVTSNICVYGGNQDVRIISYPTSFIRSITYNLARQEFSFVSLSNSNHDDMWGNIVLSHKDDPDYQVTIPVDQSIRVDIPEFDFFVIKFTWSSADVDIKCGFQNNPTTVNYRDVTYNTTLSNNLNNKYVGWSQSGNPTINGQQILKWGGDATGGQGETVYFNARELNSFPYPGSKLSDGTRAQPNTPNMLPRVVSFMCAAGWYTGGASGNVTCTIYCYLGGSMQQSGTNFNNSGGETVYGPSVATYANVSTKTFFIASGKTKPASSYMKFCEIQYDRKKHTATINWDGSTIIN